MANDSTILIKNGILVSQEYNSEKKDILINGKKIKSIENEILPKKEWRIINAENLIVAPGFMSIHSHDDFYFPLKEHPQFMKSLLYQGITTSVGGNCGISNYPIDKDKLKELKSYQGFIYYKKPKFNWNSVEEYINLIKGKMILNLIPLVGHGTIRVINNGFKKEINKETLSKMKKVFEDCMDQGCFGITSGLMYMPGTYSTTDELIAMVKVLNKYPNSIYASHLRGYSDTFIESIREAIKIGKETGITVQCSHLGPFGVKFGPKIDEAINLLEKANKSGINISYDSLAYCGGSTTIMAIIPPWAYAHGLEKFLTDINNNEFYEKMISYMENYIPVWPSWEGTGWTDNFVRSLGWENLYVLGAQNKEFVGKNFIQIGKDRKIDKYEALRQVLFEESASAIMYMAGVGACIDDNHDMSYFDRMIENPMSLISVDAIFSNSGNTMPYAYGTFQRIINRYVKQKKTLTLREAVEKFTNKVSEKFNIKNRGYLKKDAYADIVIFNLNEIKDYPDIFSDKPMLSTGIKYLLINGVAVIEDEKYNSKTLAGEIVRSNKN